MPEAVIVATARTPIGRANKGSLVDCRPDDLSALIIAAVLEKVPALDKGLVEDVIWGCGQPAGEAGTNIARVAGILAGIDAPGVTVNRYCSSSLQTIRMAAHAFDRRAVRHAHTKQKAAALLLGERALTAYHGHRVARVNVGNAGRHNQSFRVAQQPRGQH